MEQLSVVLDRQTCADLLASDTVGRVAFGTDTGPRVAAVSYRWVADRIAFCAAEASELARWSPGHPVAVQVDFIDRGLLRGWSVTAAGVCGILEAPEDHPCQTWAGGGSSIALGLDSPTLTGHWLGTASRSM